MILIAKLTEHPPKYSAYVGRPSLIAAQVEQVLADVRHAQDVLDDLSLRRGDFL